MELAGPLPDTAADCERILRSLPRWFGIQESLLEYVRDADRFPTFHAIETGRSVGFLTAREHFPESWEVHCVGVLAEMRGQGIGKKLYAHVERWLAEQGVRFLQVKTLADSHPSKDYAKTRAFYASLGYTPREVLPTLWGPNLPVLQRDKHSAKQRGHTLKLNRHGEFTDGRRDEFAPETRLSFATSQPAGHVP